MNRINSLPGKVVDAHLKLYGKLPGEDCTCDGCNILEAGYAQALAVNDSETASRLPTQEVEG